MKLSIIKQETYPNCTKLTVLVSDGKTELTERFSFSAEQMVDDKWKDHVVNWFLKQKDIKIPKLEGKSFEV